MSKFQTLVEEIKYNQACEEDILDEGLGTLARNALLGATVALGGMSGANAKTDIEALHHNHEITAKYEHGGKGYSAIVKDNYGGYSYGKEQISTERGKKGEPSTFDSFMKFLKKNDPAVYNTLHQAGDQPAAFKGTPAFKEAWLKLASRKDFQELYNDFIVDNMVVPVYKRMDQATSVNLDKITTWGSVNNAIQAAIKSCIIQHGRDGAFKLIRSVVKRRDPSTKAEFLKDLYTARKAKFPAYKNRYEQEYNDLNTYLASEDSNIETAYGKEPGQSGYELDQLINSIANGIS